MSANWDVTRSRRPCLWRCPTSDSAVAVESGLRPQPGPGRRRHRVSVGLRRLRPSSAPDRPPTGPRRYRWRDSPAPPPSPPAACTASPPSRTGSVVTWGWRDADGQLGDGSKTDRARPVKLPQLTDVVSVAGGMTHSLALGRDGTRLGVGPEPRGPARHRFGVREPGPGAGAGAYGRGRHLRRGVPQRRPVKDDGTVWTWGWNGFGQLGDVTTTDRLKPVRVVGLTGVRAIAARWFHVLAVKGDGTVWGFGLNHVGQLGGTGAIARPTPAPVAGLAGVQDVAAGAYHSLAVTTDGRAFAWGWSCRPQPARRRHQDRSDHARAPRHQPETSPASPAGSPTASSHPPTTARRGVLRLPPDHGRRRVSMATSRIPPACRGRRFECPGLGLALPPQDDPEPGQAHDRPGDAAGDRRP